jgi:hypothetical protein
VYNFVTIERRSLRYCRGNSSPSDCRLFSNSEANLAGLLVLGSKIMESVVTRWLPTKDTDLLDREYKSCYHDTISGSDVAGTSEKK